jgi:hypothetical protein
VRELVSENQKLNFNVIDEHSRGNLAIKVKQIIRPGNPIFSGDFFYSLKEAKVITKKR